MEFIVTLLSLSRSGSRTEEQSGESGRRPWVGILLIFSRQELLETLLQDLLRFLLHFLPPLGRDHQPYKLLPSPSPGVQVLRCFLPCSPSISWLLNYSLPSPSSPPSSLTPCPCPRCPLLQHHLPLLLHHHLLLFLPHLLSKHQLTCPLTRLSEDCENSMENV